MKIPLVQIEVEGGVAYVTHKDAGVILRVIDHDNAKEEGIDDATDVYSEKVVVGENEKIEGGEK
jgi:hypothetical protein